jgi:hypothetical protein
MEGEWSSSHRGRCIPREITPLAICIGGWVRTKADLEFLESRKNCCPCRESNPGSQARRYTDSNVLNLFNDGRDSSEGYLTSTDWIWQQRFLIYTFCNISGGISFFPRSSACLFVGLVLQKCFPSFQHHRGANNTACFVTSPVFGIPTGRGLL